MLDWFRHYLSTPVRPLPRLPEVIDAACIHVHGQVGAFEGQPTDRVPRYSRMSDLIVGAYVRGLIEGHLRAKPDDTWRLDEAQAAAVRLAAAAEILARVLDPERTAWVRAHLPGWEGPPARNLAFGRELSRMHAEGVCDGRHLASGDRLTFARAGGLLRCLMQTTRPQG